MAIEINIAQRQDVPEISHTMRASGLGISEEKLSRFFFDVPVGESTSQIKGGIVIRDCDRVVGYSGLAPTRIFLSGRSYDGYLMGVLGLLPGYGACMFELMDVVQDFLKASFVLANTANEKSSKLWTGYGGCHSGPDDTGFIRYRLFPLGVLTLPHLSPVTDSAIDFTDTRFVAFWERYLISSPGPFVSRDPSRLQRIFGQALIERRCVLFTAQDVGGEISGYAILRARRISRMPYKRYEILDIAALGHSPGIFNVLFRKICRYVPLHGGVVLEYVGAASGVSEIVDKYLSHRRRALANTSFWSAGIPELAKAFEQNTGYLFGPFDGDRCNA